MIQTSTYLRDPWGKLSLIVCSKEPEQSARQMRNSIYSQRGHVVLFVTSDNLIEMLDMSDRGEDPSNFIVDKLEAFLLQHE